ncbi:MAG: molecular chaperone DnaJ [bacterium]|nr:molecular chaperone DnaJ [bacterium]
MHDPYDILGVKRDATDDDIKKAYRRLSKQHHPDLNKDNPKATEKFKEINAAYQILGDKQRRGQYDQFGAAGMGVGPAGDGGFGGFDFSGFQGAGGFTDIFETFFGGASGSRGRRKPNFRGQDLEVQIAITFEEAVFGVDKKLSLTKEISCSVCDGEGVEKGSKIVDCSECRGTGEIMSVKNTILGQVRTSSLCHRCGGDGQIPEKSCPQCRGKGTLHAAQEVTVRIPAGVSDGTTLRLSGKGDAGVRGHQAGDLYVHLRVKSSAEFKRQGDHISTEQTIHVLQAVLGDEVEVRTVHGPIKLRIPAGTSDGQTFRINGKGVPRLNSSTLGDHLVTFHLEIPKKLMKSEEEHYKELAKLAKLSTKSKDKSFFSKLFS